ncbi:MAG TPA: hypothetical protein GXX51_01665 [Firmicutes bacterium]|nr:hypothetical protein [Bacillota bacterium]
MSKHTFPLRYDAPEEEDYSITCTDSALPDDPHPPIDANWVYGISCDETFKDLTPFERTLIKIIMDPGIWTPE